MKKMLLALILLATLGPAVPLASEPDVTSEILALERQVMDALGRGNLDVFLSLADADITYFHVMTRARVDGLAAVKSLVEPYRGVSLFDSYEMVEPKVQASGDTAILTYVLLRRNGSATSRWNATQIYRKGAQGWRIIHSHWSQTAS